jgi:hypothetical protein
MRKYPPLILLAALLVTATARAQPKGDADAVPLYLQAAGLLKVDCPSASNEVFAGEPFENQRWQQVEKKAFENDQHAFALVAQARSLDGAKWPVAPGKVLNEMRNLANHLGDAAVYLAIQGDEPGAIEKINDLLHLADLLEKGADRPLIHSLVAEGIRALTAYKVMLIASDVRLTKDPANPGDLQVNAALQLINRLLDQTSAEDRIKQLPEMNIARPTPKEVASVDRVKETFRRINAEQSMAAMSLGCHIYYFEQHHWPTSASDLDPNYLAKPPIDPWGDGKQTLGYVLIKGGLPDGSDRPMVYSRCQSADGLFFRVDQPLYEFYNPLKDRKQGGLFRDVARWTKRTPTAPTTQRIPLSKDFGSGAS